MAAGVPSGFVTTCPRCKTLREFVNVDGGTLFRCGGCEWYWTLGTQAPTNTINASRAPGTNTLPVASGGASFTSGMRILVDTGTNAEVVTATATGSGTSVPVTTLIKNHASSAAIGQLLISSTLGGVGQDAVPPLPGYGF